MGDSLSTPRPTGHEPSCRGVSVDHLGNDRPVTAVLNTAFGQLRAVAEMVDENRACEWILHQLSAVQGELDRVRRDVLTTHLEHRLAETVPESSDDIVRDIITAVYGGSPPPRADSAKLRGRSRA